MKPNNARENQDAPAGAAVLESFGMTADLYLLERFVATQERALAAEQALVAAARLAEERTAIRYLGSIFLPEDETCFCLFEAGSRSALERLGERAGVDYERIVPALKLAAARSIETDGAKTS